MADGTSRAATTGRRDGRLVNLALLLGVVALFAVPLGLRLNASGGPEGESYPGTDSTAADMVAEVDPDYEPWLSPLLGTSSGEVESGLFALQAAVGAGAFGFALGRLCGRRSGRE
jgi:cobalt/nickel transport protein